MIEKKFTRVENFMSLKMSTRPWLYYVGCGIYEIPEITAIVAP